MYSFPMYCTHYSTHIINPRKSHIDVNLKYITHIHIVLTPMDPNTVWEATANPLNHNPNTS